MLKKTITYTDYNGETRTEDFYFNLTKAELIEMQVSEGEGFSAYIDKIVKSKDQKEIINIFKKILLKSYGEKSSDGRRFMKSPEISKAFSETEAYNMIFMELAENSDEASRFINGLLPKDATSKPNTQNANNIVIKN